MHIWQLIVGVIERYIYIIVQDSVMQTDTNERVKSQFQQNNYFCSNSKPYIVTEKMRNALYAY